VKSSPSHKVHGVVLISVFLALNQTLAYTAKYGAVHRAMCLFTSQLSLVRNAPTHGGLARLS